MTREPDDLLTDPAKLERTDRAKLEGSADEPVDYSDPNVTLDADEDSWAWRAKLRRNPTTHLLYRIAVAVVGGLITVGGIVAIPAPGPGWLIVFFGLTILASEFEFAQRMLHFARRHVSQWNDWVMSQAMWIRCLVALATLLFVWALFWAYFAWQGVPVFFPDWAEQLLGKLPGIG